MRAIGAFGVFVGVVLLVGGCSSPGTPADPGGAGAPSGDPIVIGLETPASGPSAADGASATAGAQLAIDAVNAAGGVLDRPLSLEIGDDQGQAAQGPVVAQKLLSSGIVAVVGGSYSGPSLSSASEYQDAGIPMVTAYAVHPDITKAGDHIFRIWPVADVEGEALAEYAHDELGVSSVGVLNLDNDFGTSLATGFSTAFEASGGSVVSQRSEQIGATDFSAALTTIAAADPDSLFIAAYYSEAAQIVKQARSMGLDVPIFGAGFDSPLFMQLAGSASDDVTFISDFTTDSDDPAVKKFIEDYKAMTGKEPDSNAASAYDCVLVIANAIKEADSTDGAEIAAAIQATDIVGVTGAIGFTSAREVKRTLFLNQVSDGKIESIGQIEIGNE
jgi:branched-chain amino acid transport system substrate-binding protein